MDVIVTTKQKLIASTQKRMKKESKHNTKNKKPMKYKEREKKKKGTERNSETARKQLTKWK